MDLPARLEHLLLPLRKAFRREATFDWFILLIWGILLRDDSDGITSCLRGLGLPERAYHPALHFFHSTAFSAKNLSTIWTKRLLARPEVRLLRGQPLFAGDGLKVAKEGRRMPAVKLQHQESGNVSKPEYIHGHYFGALNLLMGREKHTVAVPVAARLEDGLPGLSEKTLVDRMGDNCMDHMPEGSYAVLDSYYAAANLIQQFREHHRFLITRVRSTTVAYLPLVPGPPRRGRPAIWGQSVHLMDYFDEKTDFTSQNLTLYGEREKVEWRAESLYWDSPTNLVRFVWVRRKDGSKVIFLTTDLSLTGAEVIETYCLRFKIELCFRTMHQLLGGFDYHFWMKNLPKLSRSNRRKRKQPESEIPQGLWAEMRSKIEAYDRHVTLCGLALGALQLLALEIGEGAFGLNNRRRWLRTEPKGHPSERMVLWALVDELSAMGPESRENLLLTKLMNRWVVDEEELANAA